MLKEDIGNTCFTTSVRVPDNMSCVLIFVVLTFLCQKVRLYAIEPSEMDCINMVKVGKNINQIPQGRRETETLNLGYNHLSSLPEYVFYNNSYKSLTEIELHQNKISDIDVTAFRGLKQLTHVVLSDNNITYLHPHTFKYNTKIEKLDLTRNQINFTSLQVFLVQSNLETLILTENRIAEIYDVTFVAVPNLKNLVLDGNMLSLIARDSFKPLKKLQYLSLTNTGVYRLSESMFGNKLPRIVDLQETPLAKRFSPPLKKITTNALRSLINIDNLLVGGTAV